MSDLQFLEITSRNYLSFKSLLVLPLRPQCYQRESIQSLPSYPVFTPTRAVLARVQWPEYRFKHCTLRCAQNCHWNLQRETLPLLHFPCLRSPKFNREELEVNVPGIGIKNYDSVTYTWAVPLSTPTPTPNVHSHGAMARRKAILLSLFLEDFFLTFCWIFDLSWVEKPNS
jgi:hypothetical protein